MKPTSTEHIHIVCMYVYIYIIIYIYNVIWLNHIKSTLSKCSSLRIHVQRYKDIHHQCWNLSDTHWTSPSTHAVFVLGFWPPYAWRFGPLRLQGLTIVWPQRIWILTANKLDIGSWSLVEENGRWLSLHHGICNCTKTIQNLILSGLRCVNVHQHIQSLRPTYLLCMFIWCVNTTMQRSTRLCLLCLFPGRASKNPISLSPIPSGNQTWQWKMDPLSVIFRIKPLFIRDFPAMFDDRRVSQKPNGGGWITNSSPPPRRLPIPLPCLQWPVDLFKVWDLG